MFNDTIVIDDYPRIKFYFDKEENKITLNVNIIEDITSYEILNSAKSIDYVPRSNSKIEMYFNSNGFLQINILKSNGDCKNLEYSDFIFLSCKKASVDFNSLFICLNEMMNQNGIESPNKDFYVVKTSSLSGLIEIPLIAWLMYPIIRESNDIRIAANVDSFKLTISRFGPLEYKNLVHKAFDKTTPKLLKSLWNFICIDKVFSTNPCGDLCLSDDRFSIALAVYKAFGIDYLYQLFSYGTRGEATERYSLYEDTSEECLLILSKYFNKSKIVKMYCLEGISYITDIVVMINYLTKNDIVPKNLRGRFGEKYKIPTKVKNLKEFHDRLSRDLTLIKAENSKIPIEYTEKEKELDGLQIDDLRFVLAKNTSDLSKWGSKLNVCIASYDKKATDKKCILVGIEKENEISYVIELKPINGELSKDVHSDSVIVQLVSKNNQKLPAEEENKITKLILFWYSSC